MELELEGWSQIKSHIYTKHRCANKMCQFDACVQWIYSSLSEQLIVETILILAKFKLSSHKFQRARWCKDKMPYHEKTCSVCNVHDLQDGYHIALICEYFKDVWEKYDKHYYCNRQFWWNLYNSWTLIPQNNDSDLCYYLKLFLNYMLKFFNSITDKND